MLFTKSYDYVGPEQEEGFVDLDADCVCVTSGNDIRRWVDVTDQELDYNDEVIATFVVKKDKRMYITDRHAEHYACANGAPVLSAGEITFHIGKTVEVTEITNQSTGYCPEPGSWKAVDKALKKAGIDHQKRFTTEFQFRKCGECDTINVIKDDWYVCAMCDADLDKKSNVHS